MKRLSLKDVIIKLKVENDTCVRINEYTRQIHLVRFSIGCSDTIIGYLTFNQFIKLDLLFGLVELPINSYVFDYYRLGKENK